MTQARGRTPADVLLEARRRDSKRKRKAVFQTVDRMRKEGVKITFAGVARAAGVSQWLVYADGMRDYVTAARDAQTADPVNDQRLGRRASGLSLLTDLELARQDNKALRTEVGRLQQLMREQLGERLEFEATQSLRLRVDELTGAVSRYSSENAQLTGEVNDIRAQLLATEQDLAAARTSLRRMIKEQSQDIGVTPR